MELLYRVPQKTLFFETKLLLFYQNYTIIGNLLCQFSMEEYNISYIFCLKSKRSKGIIVF